MSRLPLIPRLGRPLLAGQFLLVLVFCSATAAASNDLTCRLSDELVASFSSRAEPVTALAVSGGGSRGAWGAGYLSGWQAAGKKLDVVTGVSVGALLASHAYLGLYEDDGPGLLGLKTVFENLGNRQVRRRRVPILWALLSDSAYTNRRLAKTLRRVITEELLLSINQRQQTQPGLLCVATVNLRTGALVRWDLTRIATEFAVSEGDRREALLDLYRSVLLAATSIPGVFSPAAVLLDGTGFTVQHSASGDKHIDSGVRAQVVGPGEQEGAFQKAYGSLFSELKKSNAPPPEVFVLINAETKLDENWQERPRLFPVFPVFTIAGRSVLIILNETALNSRRQIIAQANEFNATCQAVAMRPQDVRPLTCKAYAKQRNAGNPPPLDALEFDCSRELFAFGETRGGDADWQACESL